MSRPKLTPTFNDTKEIKASLPSMVLPQEETPCAVLNVFAPDHIIPPHEPLDGEPWTSNPEAKAGDPMPDPDDTMGYPGEPAPKKKRGRPRKVKSVIKEDGSVEIDFSNEPPAPCETIPEGLHPHLNGGEQLVMRPKWWENAIIGPEGKVALIGTAPSSRLLAPYKDEGWKIWGCSPGNMNTLPRVDVWFEIHSTLTWPENQGYGMPYLKWLSEQKFPVFMQDIEENSVHVPNFTPFPVNELVAEFGPFFFTSSFAWMMALAMVRGAKQIALFGIDMASRDEYILQRPGAYYFFMEAKRRGIAIGAPNESDIMQPPPPYGFFETSSFGRKICAREKELKDRIGPMKAELGKLQANITYLEGALEDLDYVKNIWGGAQLFGSGHSRMAVIPGK